MLIKNKAQIWIETVIYTLIGLAIIGILLSFINPAIQNKECEMAVNNAVTILNGFQSVIDDVSGSSAGNARTIDEMKLSMGTITIDASSDTILYDVECGLKYSEPGSEVPAGNNIIALTKQLTNGYHITLFLNYTNKADLQFNGEETEKSFEQSPTPYSLSVLNEGTSANFPTLPLINIKQL